jgi:hypothetical protein
MAMQGIFDDFMNGSMRMFEQKRLNARKGLEPTAKRASLGVFKQQGPKVMAPAATPAATPAELMKPTHEQEHVAPPFVSYSLPMEVAAMPVMHEDAMFKRIRNISILNSEVGPPKSFQEAFKTPQKIVMIQMKDTLGTFERLSKWAIHKLHCTLVRFEMDDDELTSFLRNVWVAGAEIVKLKGQTTTSTLPVMPIIMYPTINMMEKLLDLKRVPGCIVVVVDDAYAPEATIRKLRSRSQVVVVPALCEATMKICINVMESEWQMHIPNKTYLLDRANGDTRWLYNNLYFDKLQGAGGMMFFDTVASDVGLLRQADMLLFNGHRNVWRYHVSPPLTPREQVVLWKNQDVIRVEADDVYARVDTVVRGVTSKECVTLDFAVTDSLKTYLSLNYKVALEQAAFGSYVDENAVALMDAVSFVADRFCDADILDGKYSNGTRDVVDLLYLQATHVSVTKHFPLSRRVQFDSRLSEKAHGNYYQHLRKLKTMHTNADNWYHMKQDYSPVSHLWNDFFIPGATPEFLKQEAARYMVVALLLTPPIADNALLRDMSRDVPDPEDRKARTVAEWFGYRTGFINDGDNENAAATGKKAGYNFASNDAWMFAWALLAKLPFWSSLSIPLLINTILFALRTAKNMHVDTAAMYIYVAKLKEQETVKTKVQKPAGMTEAELIKKLPVLTAAPKVSFRPCTNEGCAIGRCEECLTKLDWNAPCAKCDVSPCANCRVSIDRIWRIMVAKNNTFVNAA